LRKRIGIVVPFPDEKLKRFRYRRGAKLPATETAEWKGNVVHDVCVASGDRDYDEWKAWLAPCLVDQSDMLELARTPEKKFQSIDAKLAQALRKMIENADKASQVKAELRLKTQQYGKGELIKGRELFAMILESFKFPDHKEVSFNAHHPLMLQYYGDNRLEAFYMKWLDIIYNMRPDDKPSKNTLRDTSFRKIEDSKLMQYEFSKYKTFFEGNPKRHKYLSEMIKGYIARGKQERLLQERERAMKLSLQDSRTPPAEVDDPLKTAAPSTKNKKENPAAPSNADPPKPKAKPQAKSDAESALPTPSPKSHSDNKKKTGKGGKGPRSSSPTDKKKILCNYFSNKRVCNKGDKCAYSHSKKVYGAKMSQRKGRSGSRD
jgi:hypothetical protein